MSEGTMPDENGSLSGRIVVGASRQLSNLAMILITVMMLHITADVVSKYLFNAPIDGTLETVALYYMVAIVFLPLAYATHEGGQIVVELFTRGLSQRSTLMLDGLIGLFCAAFLALFSWQTGLEALARTYTGEVRETAVSLLAIWPSRWLPAIGYGVMAIYMFYRGIADLSRSRHDGEAQTDRAPPAAP